MDRKAAETLQISLQAELDSVGADQTPRVRVTPGQGNTYRVTFKAEETEIGSMPARFRAGCIHYGLDADELWGREFAANEDRYRVVAVSTHASKYPVGATRLRDGTHFKFSHTLFSALEA